MEQSTQTEAEKEIPTFGKIDGNFREGSIRNITDKSLVTSLRLIEQQMGEERRLEQNLKSKTERIKFCEDAQRENEIAWANNNSLKLPANQ
ncbi:Oidioi.mRNA.OKI2018_I69.chr2.g6747.t1.cds [Oikopleura dioica]|uniref:Oidioi.mRNA.OKI2018_I69.chr2.g6747.t1.cds n=1 Tax=Oikopleura dioica TaxID=34765 RepID=A0ABN7T4N4_OIKDI|nr:Oidioi.mRNA.OKI2018_I69.chr2.g6747.t1.cds [Oikopleura dioica]